MKKLLIIGALALSALTSQAQSANPIDAALNLGQSVLAGPWIVGSGYGRGLDTGNNLVYGYLGYNFVLSTNITGFSAGVIGGYDYLWHGKNNQVNSLSGGFSVGETFKPLALIGLKFGTNVTATVSGYQLICTPRDSSAPIGSITGVSATVELYQYSGFHLKAQGMYETRAGQGQWNDKYLCGGLAISHLF